MSKTLYTRHGGYRKLYSFTFATMIHLATIKFCKRFVSFKDDPLGKTAGQMVGAARSGRQNIIEGSERAATSRETEIKLVDVARASLMELLGDYEIYLADQGAIPWSREDNEWQTLNGLQVNTFEHTNNSMHDYWQYYHREKQAFIPWLENADDLVAANSMLVLVGRTTGMLDAQLKRLGTDFAEEGGFRERMYQVRNAERTQTNSPEENSPNCPKCGKPMRRRMPHNGANPGRPFWGCTGFPTCRATRPVEQQEEAV